MANGLGHVDVHSHLSHYPNTIAGAERSQRGGSSVAVEDALGLAPSWLAEMNRSGIETTVTFDLDNDLTARLLKAHDRFRGMVVVDPRDAENAERTVRRFVAEGGFVGVKCSPSGDYSHDGQPYLPNDRRAWPFYDFLARAGLPILFHTGIIFRDPTAPTSNRVECCRPLYLDDVARAFPDLQVIVGHAGRPLWQETLCLANQDNVWIDLTWSQLPLPLYRHTISYCLDGFGPGRMMFGSDSTPSMPQRATELLAETKRLLDVHGCSTDEVEATLGGNARRLLFDRTPRLP